MKPEERAKAMILVFAELHCNGGLPAVVTEYKRILLHIAFFPSPLSANTAGVYSNEFHANVLYNLHIKSFNYHIKAKSSLSRLTRERKEMSPLIHLSEDDDEVKINTILLKKIRENLRDLNAIAAKRRKDFNDEIFRQLTLLLETYAILEA